MVQKVYDIYMTLTGGEFNFKQTNWIWIWTNHIIWYYDTGTQNNQSTESEILAIKIINNDNNI